MSSPFIALFKIVDGSGMEPLEFITQVNRHIEALTAWEEAGRPAIDRLRRTPMPQRSECDSDTTFENAMKLWSAAQDPSSHPAPSAPIAIERAIEVHTAPDGSRTYTYIEDEWGVNSVYRDLVIQRSKIDGGYV